MRRLALFAGLCIALSACGHKAGAPGPVPEPTGTVDTFLTHKGTPMPLQQALKTIAFRPFIPSRQIIETAAIPGFLGIPEGQAEDPRNWGIAFQYTSGRHTFVLSEWPHGGRPMSGPRNLGTENGCSISLFGLGNKPKHEGAVWAGPRILSKLEPTDDAPNNATRAEARRLVRRGACKS